MAERPLGITIIAILGFIGAILLIIGGLLLLFAGAFLGALFGPLGAILGASLGVVVLIIGIIQFVISYGLWKMKKWALYIELILLIIGIIFYIIAIVSGDLFSIVSLIISAIVFYYLYTKRKLFA